MLENINGNMFVGKNFQGKEIVIYHEVIFSIMKKVHEYYSSLKHIRKVKGSVEGVVFAVKQVLSVRYICELNRKYHLQQMISLTSYKHGEGKYPSISSQGMK